MADAQVRDKLWHTREVLHHALVHPNVNVREYLENDPEAYYSNTELLEVPLLLRAQNLTSFPRRPSCSVQQYREQADMTSLLALCSQPLTLIYNSLLSCGDSYIAYGRLLDCIRQVIRWDML